jgi:hypothetical protein
MPKIAIISYRKKTCALINNIFRIAQIQKNKFLLFTESLTQKIYCRKELT